MQNSKNLNLKQRVVHLYMQDWLPSAHGTGTNNRIYSNLRAYVDLGYQAEVICFQKKDDFKFEPLTEYENVKWTHIKIAAKDSIFDKFSYLTGIFEDRALDYRFKSRKVIRTEINKRMQNDSNALHHFEYLDTACAYINFKECRSIWSMHDLESKFLNAHRQIRSELKNGKKHSWEDRAASYLALAEKKAAQQSKLTLCIAKHEKDFLVNDWSCSQAEFFPMSLPDEQVPPRNGDWMPNGKLRILHLGRVDSLPSYRSLEFLLEKVFPILPKEISNKIELIVVGECRESERTAKIRDLAQKFSFVKFLGFQKDLKKQYSNADLQIVGSTEATGLRTRIVESFAYKVPVLSTTVGAEGVEGLANNENIFLADTPEGFRDVLGRILGSTRLLNAMADSGRSLYDTTYSRRAVSQKLGSLLEKYSKNLFAN